MSNFKLETGLKGSREYCVEVEDSAKFLGSGDLEVLSTPAMIAMMEETARISVEDKLPSGFTTVGIKVNVSHMRAVPVGCRVKVKSELIEVKNRRLRFRVEAYHSGEKIGEGFHERFIVNRRRFLERVKERYST